MIEVFYIGQGKTLPYYDAQVRDEDGAVTLSTITAVYFSLKNLSTGSVVLSKPALVVNQVEGLAEYQWAVGDTDTVGEYAAEFTFLTPDGSFSLPRNTIAKVVVEDQFATG